MAALLEKTFDKLRAGELPPPTTNTAWILNGNGTSCSGCGEPMYHDDRVYSTHVSNAATQIVLRFHCDCYEAWVKFKHRR
jgi:hypothetical protein